MTVARPEFVPDASLSHEEMAAMQREIAAVTTFTDDLPWPDPEAGPRLVAGVDQAFEGDTATSAVVVLEADSCVEGGDPTVLERVHATESVEIPYVPGLLSFREGNPVLRALECLETTPDVVLLDGSGRIHYREAGLATHVGVVLDLPTVGVAKSLLCGRPTASLEEPLGEGERVPIEADAEVSAPAGTTIGYALQTRQFDSTRRHVNPLYVSPGHRVSATRAADIVEACCVGYKLPEPIRLADQEAGRLTRGT